MSEDLVGRVHSVETFSTLDGPGIRYVLFMQGCPLRCIYCQNVDTWMFEDGEEKSVSDIILDLTQQVTFYKNNKGGITVSGGEPLIQARFVTELFKRAKSLGITTALDTSGCVPLSQEIDKLLEFCDYILIDVKHVDPAKHVIITGRSPGLIRAFIEHIQTLAHVKLWVRHVVVPGYTTDDEDVCKIAEYIASLSHVERIDLLPYHSMGEYKWEILQRDYKLKDIQAPSRELIQSIAEKMRLHAGIHPGSAYDETR